MTTTAHFRIATKALQDAVLFACAGEVDLSNVHLLREPLQAELRTGRRLTVDLREVSYLDSTAIGVLIGVARALIERRERLSIVATPKQQRLFTMVGCSSFITLINGASV